MDENIGRRDARLRMVLGGALVAAAVLVVFALQTAVGAVAALALGLAGLSTVSSGVNRTSHVRAWFTRRA